MAIRFCVINTVLVKYSDVVVCDRIFDISIILKVNYYLICVRVFLLFGHDYLSFFANQNQYFCIQNNFELIVKVCKPPTQIKSKF